MGLISDFMESMASGFASATAELRSHSDPAVLAVERCCERLGWSIDERPSAKELVLYFKDPLIRRRKVHLRFGELGIYATFNAHSSAWIPAERVPEEVLAYLLERNSNPFVCWQMCVGDDGVGFLLSYFAIATGLNENIFKLICETMIEEAHEFDKRMNKAGLIR